MGMKPRLNDGPQNMEGLATQAKKVDEFANVGDNLATTLKVEPSKQLKGTDKPS